MVGRGKKRLIIHYAAHAHSLQYSSMAIQPDTAILTAAHTLGITAFNIPQWQNASSAKQPGGVLLADQIPTQGEKNSPFGFKTQRATDVR